MTRAGGGLAGRGVPELVERIAGRIRRDGPVPFADFMATALYDPSHGYYTCGRPAGMRDFRTSPQIHRVFADLLAAQGAEMRHRLQGGGRFRWIELGPGDGALAAALLESLGDAGGDWDYHLVEVSPGLRAVQERALGALPEPVRRRVRWSGFEDLARDPSDGVVVSNEFFDALPVRRIRRDPDGLVELRVGWDRTRGFHDVAVPAPPELRRYVGRYGAPLPEGAEAEVNLEALRWVDRTEEMLRCGYAITIDYGDHAGGLMKRCPRGTVMGYHAHRASEEPYERVGEQDLTAHVNFTALVRRGEERGLISAPLRTQTEFLLGLGILERMESIDRCAPDEAARWRERLAVKDLFVPGGMGEKFRVLIQAKGAPLDGLSGLSAPWRTERSLDPTCAQP